MRAALGPQPGGGFAAARAIYLRRLGDDALGTLAKLFWVGAPVDVRRLRRVLDPDGLVHAGLLEVRDGRARARCKLAVHEDLYLACDFEDRRLEPQYVSGASPSALMLADLTIRRPARRALDVGTGSGIQALLAARHSDAVVGVDVNDRAFRFAALNLQLNGIDHVEPRLGSWFEPVGESEFDLVVANPPYVVSPDRELVYRDSDLAGDEVSRMVVRGAAERLAEGGFASVAWNSVDPPGGDWRAPVESAFAGTGCDAVLLRYVTFEPLDYAVFWNTILEEDVTAFAETLDRWTRFFVREGIESISAGFVVLRRRSGGANWIRAFEVPGLPARGAGRQLERLFTGKDFLRAVGGGEALLDYAFSLPDDVKFEHRFAPGEEGHTLVRTPASVGFAARIAPEAARALAQCDGQRRLRDLGVDDGLLEGAKRLLELGFLVPPAD